MAAVSAFRAEGVLVVEKKELAITSFRRRSPRTSTSFLVIRALCIHRSEMDGSVRRFRSERHPAPCSATSPRLATRTLRKLRVTMRQQQGSTLATLLPLLSSAPRILSLRCLSRRLPQCPHARQQSQHDGLLARPERRFALRNGVERVA